jgi:hypothetical protein
MVCLNTCRYDMLRIHCVPANRSEKKRWIITCNNDIDDFALSDSHGITIVNEVVKLASGPLDRIAMLAHR